MKKGQAIIGFALLAGIIALGLNKYAENSKLMVFLITGLILGYVIQRSRFGFAGGVRRTVMLGDGTLAKSLLFLFAVTIVGAAGIHFAAAQGGAEAAFRAAKDAVVIPGTGSVSAINLAFIIGGILFGIGMIFGGGCASGTLTDTGEGSGRGMVVLLFFCIGGMLGTWNLPMLKETILFKGGLTMYLPDNFGYLGSVVISLLVLLALYGVVKKYENKRKNEGTFIVTEIPEDEMPMEEMKDYKFFSKETYHKLFVERWSYYVSAALIAIMFIFIINTTKSSWGASGPYTHWGVWLFSKLGIDFGAINGFAGSVKVVEGGVLNDPVSVRNIGIILGAAICMLLATKWKFIYKMTIKDASFYALGGILMGYGAKLSGGCNVGALFSGIANLSLSGWVFLVLLVIGGIIGVQVVKKLDLQ